MSSCHKSEIFICSIQNSILTLLLLTIGVSPRAEAQSIIPAQDGTATVVKQNGQQFNITGGTISGDNTNLFHSFQQFNLNAGEIANFLVSPNIKNILGRVVGQNASVINGLIKLTGGNANLFLLNPTGIVFGSNAQLNVPGSFTATTATGIGFGNNWFQAIGSNNYTALIGEPNQFSFNINQPGSIINQGSLQVGIGQNLNLIGGNVINTGNLTAPEGDITITAVPGSSLVKVSQIGHLLNLEITPQQGNTFTNITPLTLPQLLTGGSLNPATGITVDPTGQISLTSLGMTLPNSGDVAVVSGNLNVSGQTGGVVNVLGNSVNLIDAKINASGISGGGQVLIGGGLHGEGTVPNAESTFVDQNTLINANALTSGNGGQVIVWSDGVTEFDGNINALGGSQSGNGGFVETSGKNLLTIGDDAKVNTFAPQGKLGTWLLDPNNLTVVGTTAYYISDTTSNNLTTITPSNSNSNSTISALSIVDALCLNNVLLSASNSITINAAIDASANTQAGNLTLSTPTVKLNAPITLYAGSTLSGNAMTVNVGSSGSIQGSIQNAIDVAATGANVNLAAGTYTLSQEIDINNKSLNLTGAGENSTLISGNNQNEVLSLLYSGGNNNNVVNLNKLSIVNGSNNSVGGGIYLGAGTLNFSNGMLSGNSSSLGGAIYTLAGTNLTLNNVTISNNSAVNGGGIYNAGTNLTLNNVTISNNNAASGGGIYNVNSGTAKVMLNNVTISNNSAATGVGGGIYNYDTALTLNNVTISNNSAATGGGIYNDVAGTTVVNNNSIFSSNSAANGSGIYNAGTTTVNSSTFSSNSASVEGGGIYNTGTTTVNNSTFSSNSAGNGGGIYNDVTGTTVVNNNSIFSSNSASGSGGGIYNTGTTTVDSSTFSSNSASGSGGGIYNTGTTVVNNNSIFSSNSASGSGGGIYNTGTTVVNNNSIFSSNSASGSGGGIYNTGTTTVDSSTFSNNSASGDGGGIYNTGTTTVDSSTFSNNSASGDGGGIYNTGTTTVDSSTFSNNSASGDGGGIYNTATTVVNNNSIFSSNSASGSGGGIYNTGTTTVDSSTFSNNSASGDGGGIYNTGTTTVDSSTFSNNSASGDGGGIYNTAGTTIVSSSTFSNNSASGGSGGGIYNDVTSTTVVNNNSIFSSNSASGSGGGIYNTGTTTVDSSTFSSNSASGGGGIYNDSFGTTTVNSSTFSSNSASGSGGGGIYNDGTTTVNSSIFSSNSASGGGGGIYNDSFGTTTVNSSTFSSNSAGNDGGIYNTGTANITSSSINYFTETGGTVTFNGDVSATQVDTDPNSIVNISGNINTTGAQIYDGAVTIANNPTLTASIIGFQSNVDGNSNLTINTSQGVNFLGAVNVGSLTTGGNGSITILGNLTTQGGGVNLTTKSNISTGNIATNGSDITLNGENITTGTLNTSTTNQGGNVDITALGSYRGIGTFIDSNGILSSISTAGKTSGGSITINYGAPSPFIIGDSTVQGTAGAITSSANNIIAPEKTILNTYYQGNISLIPSHPILSIQPTPSSIPIFNLPTITLPFKGTQLQLSYDNFSNLPVIAENDFISTAITNSLAQEKIEVAVPLIEEFFNEKYTEYYDSDIRVQPLTIKEIETTLQQIAHETGKRTAVVYIISHPDSLELIAVLPNDKMVHKTIKEVDRQTLLQIVQEFRKRVASPLLRNDYKPPAEKLYQLLISPIEPSLKAEKIDNLLFATDSGLRLVPFAALYDGHQFLVEKYSLGIIPSFSLLDTHYNSLQHAHVLAMGASKFTGMNSLPSVKVELPTIVQLLGQKRFFINDAFTIENLLAQHELNPTQIIHLATHATFNAGVPHNSYIQFWGQEKLRLDNLTSLNFHNRPVELLVLSACRTALGDEKVELGFTGLAVRAGVKSALGSLWSVSDQGTLALMTEVYSQLRKVSIKAEALRQAQIAMIRGNFSSRQTNQSDTSSQIDILNKENLSHPYYWAAFVLVGSPW